MLVVVDSYTEEVGDRICFDVRIYCDRGPLVEDVFMDHEVLRSLELGAALIVKYEDGRATYFKGLYRINSPSWSISFMEYKNITPLQAAVLEVTHDK